MFEVLLVLSSIRGDAGGILVFIGMLVLFGVCVVFGNVVWCLLFCWYCLVFVVCCLIFA